MFVCLLWFSFIHCSSVIVVIIALFVFTPADGLIGLGVLGGVAAVGGVVAVGVLALAGLGFAKAKK